MISINKKYLSFSSLVFETKTQIDIHSWKERKTQPKYECYVTAGVSRLVPASSGCQLRLEWNLCVVWWISYDDGGRWHTGQSGGGLLSHFTFEYCLVNGFRGGVYQSQFQVR